MSSSLPQVRPSAQASARNVLPLALFTCIGLMATELHLPSVPLLPEILQGSVTQAQQTVAIFFFSFAVFQLFYGAFADAWGRVHTLRAASVLFIIGSLMCALATHIYFLMAGRFIQAAGAAAGAAIVPALIKEVYSEAEAVKMIAWLGICESTIPAAAPFIGTVILFAFGWRANFILLTGIGLLSFLLLLRKRIPENNSSSTTKASCVIHPSLFAVLRLMFPNYITVASDRFFFYYALNHAAAFGGLITFVSNAPWLLRNVYACPPLAFGGMQVALVAFFILGSFATSHLLHHYGSRQVIRLGLFLVAFSAVLLLGMAFHLLPGGVWMITLVMLPSQIGLGLRFGPTFSAALDRHPGQTASASALFSFLCFATASLGSYLTAPFLSRYGLLPVAVAFVLFAAGSVICIHLAHRQPIPPPK